MAIQRTKPEIKDLENHPGGLEEFAEERKERVTKEVESPIRPGWSADSKPASTRSASNVARFKVPDDGEEILIKFLDDCPFAPIFQHWILVEGQRRAFTCLGKECPLCDRGDKPKSSDWFNVVELGETPELKVWYATSDPAAAIRERAESKRTSPINREGLYFAVSKRKASNGFNTYSIDVVKEEELEKDWGVKSLSAEAIKQFQDNAYDGSLVKIHTKAELSELARKHLED